MWVPEEKAFLEDKRVAVKPEHDEFSESVAEFMQRNSSGGNVNGAFRGRGHGGQRRPHQDAERAEVAPEGQRRVALQL